MKASSESKYRLHVRCVIMQLFRICDKEKESHVLPQGKPLILCILGHICVCVYRHLDSAADAPQLRRRRLQRPHSLSFCEGIRSGPCMHTSTHLTHHTGVYIQIAQLTFYYSFSYVLPFHLFLFYSIVIWVSSWLHVFELCWWLIKINLKLLSSSLCFCLSIILAKDWWMKLLNRIDNVMVEWFRFEIQGVEC